jgi:hypothetical protein
MAAPAGAADALAALPGDLGPRYFAANARIRLGLLIAACASCGGTPPSVRALQVCAKLSCWSCRLRSASAAEDARNDARDYSVS